MAVLLEAALGNPANRKTGQGSSEKFGYGATRIGSTLFVEADRRNWASFIRARPRSRMSAFLKSGRWSASWVYVRCRRTRDISALASQPQIQREAKTASTSKLPLLGAISAIQGGRNPPVTVASIWSKNPDILPILN